MKSLTLVFPLFASLAFSTTCYRPLRDDEDQDIPAGTCQPTFEEWQNGALVQDCHPNNPCLTIGNGCILNAQLDEEERVWKANCADDDPNNVIKGTVCRASGWQGLGNCVEYTWRRCDDKCGKRCPKTLFDNCWMGTTGADCYCKPA
ncbi:hypothetical protein EJ03DRAFT_223337 [Teratosphaeria nubilosa]|uniref:Uncharacterized protein n=1 Tax=Teratosphaeria nubilosa TaxID=161662 RepID=A0A6G1KWX8_9PEZI|nr:hypothetical protein EJ03DRAFT_223337 [Teratosphaeria nubilosa]